MFRFNDIIHADHPVLVDFSAEWCGPCKMMQPILKDVKDRLGESVTIIKIDIDRNPEAAAAYQIQAVPTLLIFKNGQMKWRHSGLMPAKELEQVMSSFI